MIARNPRPLETEAIILNIFRSRLKPLIQEYPELETSQILDAWPSFRFTPNGVEAAIQKMVMEGFLKKKSAAKYQLLGW